VPGKADLNGDWEAAASRAIDRPYLDPRVGEAKRRDHLAVLERWLPELQGTRVLKTDLWEEGVAGDELLFSLARRGASAHGIDLSERVVEGAAARGLAAGVDTALQRGSVADIPLGDGTMDVVVSTSTLDHLEEPGAYARAIAEFRRVLVPGGILVVTVDNPANAFDWLLRLAARLGLVPFPLGITLDRPELEELLRSSGFEPAEHAYLVPAPRVLATVMVRLAALMPGGLGDRAVRTVLRLFAALGRSAPRRMGSFLAVRALAR
jgi:SAM-dependent methyltransferase